MAEFHETMYGKRFFESQLPDLIKGIEKLSSSISKINPPKETSNSSSTDRIDIHFFMMINDTGIIEISHHRSAYGALEAISSFASLYGFREPTKHETPKIRTFIVLVSGEKKLRKENLISTGLPMDCQL